MGNRMLVGRESHLRMLDDAMSRARDGMASVTVLHGDAGIGKSALLAHVADDAPPDALLLTASGHEAESGLPYSGLHRMLAPLQDAIQALPDPQRAAITGALAPDFGTPSDQMATASAVLRLITSQCETRPVLIIVDDFQWLDRSSRQALIFVARRIEADGVAMFMGLRSGTSQDLDGIGSLLSVGPLTEVEARELLRVYHPDLSWMVSNKVIEQAAGLPLALIEIPAELTVGQRSARERLPARFPVGQFIERLYENRIAGLDDRARLATLIASFEDLSSDDLKAAFGACDLDMPDLDAAERGHLIRIEEGRCIFAHPTVRAAIQNAATATDLTQAHGALATCFVDEPARYAAHLKARAAVNDEEVARALVAAAKQAVAQGGFAEAAFNWESAAGRTANAATRRNHRAEAANNYLRAGLGPPALSLLKRLIDDASDVSERTSWQCMRVVAEMWEAGAPPEDRDDLARIGAELITVGGAVADQGMDLLMALAWCDLLWGNFIGGKEIVDRVRAVRPCNDLSVGHRLVCEVLDVLVGAPGSGVFLRSNWIDDLSTESLVDPAMPMGLAAMALSRLDELGSCERVAIRYREAVRSQGSFASQFSARALMAMVYERRGDWDLATLEFISAARFAVDSDFTAPYPHVAVRHAYLRAAQGKVVECQDLLRITTEFAPKGAPAFGYLTACALGRLHLSTGNHSEAMSVLSEAFACEQRMGAKTLGYSSRFVDHYETSWYLGESEAMEEQLLTFEAMAKSWDHPTSLALAARCRALLVDADAIDDAFAEVVELFEVVPSLFETGRTQFLWGQRLRRARRKGDARAHLLEAQRVFESLDAVGWLAKTRSELAACGDRSFGVIEGTAGPLSSLTPREFEVAQAVAAGASNPEAAERLFISQRTVEYHLSSVYRKLALTDRRALVPFFAIADR